MWISADEIAILMGVCRASGYKIVNKIKEEQKNRGLFVNPRAVVPVALFADLYGLELAEVKKSLKAIAC